MIHPLVLVALQYIAMAFCGALCVVGYRMTRTNPKRGHLLIGAGSAGLVLVAPNVILEALSLFWVWVAGTEHERANKSAAKPNL